MAAHANHHSAASRATLLVAIALAALLALCLCATASPGQAYGASSTPSKKAALKLLKKYDKDGYYIVNTMSKRGDDVMAWWGDSGFFSSFGTMVHEESHGLSDGIWKSDKIYVGSKKFVVVPKGNVFQSKKIAKSVPKKLRTERFWTYIGKPSPMLSSNDEGAYGILNEFMAYCWGLNAETGFYNYAAKYRVSDDLWNSYVGETASNVLAYAEFRYFTEHYLAYAKQHDKATYRAIMKNPRYRLAVKKIDKRFGKLVKKFDSRLKAISGKLRQAGYDVYLEDGMYRIEATGTYTGSSVGSGLFLDEYNDFAKELGKKKYKAIEKKLGLKPVKKRNPSIGSNPQRVEQYSASDAENIEEEQVESSADDADALAAASLD